MKTDNQQLHQDALALFGKMQPYSAYKHAKKVVWNYNQIRKQQTAKLKPILIEMDKRMKDGESFGGCSSMKDYCKRYRNQGCLTYRRCRQIITGETKPKVKALHPGDMISFNGMKIRIEKLVDDSGVGYWKSHKKGNLQLHGSLVEDKPTVTIVIDECKAAKKPTALSPKAQAAMDGMLGSYGIRKSAKGASAE
jgi:hypothetical protein